MEISSISYLCGTFFQSKIAKVNFHVADIVKMIGFTLEIAKSNFFNGFIILDHSRQRNIGIILALCNFLIIYYI